MVAQQPNRWRYTPTKLIGIKQKKKVVWQAFSWCLLNLIPDAFLEPAYLKYVSKVNQPRVQGMFDSKLTLLSAIATSNPSLNVTLLLNITPLIRLDIIWLLLTL